MSHTDASRIPTHAECILLLETTGCNKDVIDHCKTVATLALNIAKDYNGVNLELIECGALLHDIGRGQTHMIEHAVIGAEIVRKLSLDNRLVLIIERHIGAGITQDNAKMLGLEEKNYIPESMEEKIVAHADNLIVGTNIVALNTRIEMMNERDIDSDSITRVRELAHEIMREG